MFANAACDAAGAGEGFDYLGSFDVTADAGGEAPFSAPVSLPTGAFGALFLTATATDSEGNSSEFSDCRLLPAVPVVLLGCEATPHPGGVRLTWSVRDDGGIVGFRLWRRSVDEVSETTAAWEERTLAPLVGTPGGGRRWRSSFPAPQRSGSWCMMSVDASAGS